MLMWHLTQPLGIIGHALVDRPIGRNGSIRVALVIEVVWL